MGRKKKISGTIYLLHFSQNYKHARHYIGFVAGGEAEVRERIDRHRRGEGARLLEVVVGAGITFEVVRSWSGDRNFERKLKKKKCAPRLCPICSGKEKAARRAA